MSSTYYPAADPGDHEHELIKGGPGSPHQPYGSHLGSLEVGTPGTSKGDMVFRPIFHLTLPDEGKVEDDVVSAKLCLAVNYRVGSPQNFTYRLSHVSQFDWYDFYTHGSGAADYTCYQSHLIKLWEVAWGDVDTPYVDFTGPSGNVLLEIPITDMIKDAITNHGRDMNVLISSPSDASTSWNFDCKHCSSPSHPWYVEIEWAAAGKSQVMVF